MARALLKQAQKPVTILADCDTRGSRAECELRSLVLVGIQGTPQIVIVPPRLLGTGDHVDDVPCLPRLPLLSRLPEPPELLDPQALCVARLTALPHALRLPSTVLADPMPVVLSTALPLALRLESIVLAHLVPVVLNTDL